MEDTEEAPRRSAPPGRSQASGNWRMKDTTARPEPAPQTRNNRTFNQNRNDTSSPGARDSSAPGTRLYVGNLLYTASRQDVEALFVENGFAITGISMSVDPFTGRNPSYAFVDFETAEDANRAMENLNGMEVGGRAVKINPGVRRQGGQGGQGGESGTQSRVRNYDARRGGREESGEVPSGYKPSFDRWSRSDAPSHSNSSEQGLRLYVGNLPRIEPQAAADAQMQELFGSEGFELTAVSKMIAPHPSKVTEAGNHYFCFVDLASADEVDRAIEALNGREVEGWGTIRVSKARDNRDRKQVREQGGGYQRTTSGAKTEDAPAWR